MRWRNVIISCMLACGSLWLYALGAEISQEAVGKAVEIVRYGRDYSTAHLEAVRMDGRKGIAVLFEGTEGMHYYARPDTAPAKNLALKVTAEADGFKFGEPVFERWKIFDDPTGQRVEVYAGDFAVFVPIEAVEGDRAESDITVRISGIACTSMICLAPFEKTLQTTVNLNSSDTWRQISFKAAAEQVTALEQSLSYPIWYALGLALLAGLSLNIMPCVWPVLPIVVLRIVEQAKKSRGAKFTMGLAFCLGILLFFACLAIANAVLHLAFGTELQWGDQFRNPAFVIAMALVLIVLALFMFDVFTIAVPAAISGKTSAVEGYLGTVGMGFLAAILSTPCSFGLLAAAFAWAQGQPLGPATVAILFIGLGMGIPYLVLTSIPGLLERLPKPGRWMDLFKKFVGFVLLGIAVWMVTVVPAARRAGVLYYSVVLAFCVWMWGGWVSYNSKVSAKIIVRAAAIIVAIVAGLWLLRMPAKLIDWQKYDAQLVEESVAKDKPVLIEFTADWCISCKAVEKLVYSRKDVAELIKEKNVVPIKADTTVKDYPATLALRNFYEEPGVPVTILLSPGGQQSRWRGKAFGDKLVEQLKKLP